MPRQAPPFGRPLTTVFQLAVAHTVLRLSPPNQRQNGETYANRIRVRGHLDLFWQIRFEGWRIQQQPVGTTLLSGTLPDQAALQGMLLQIIRLGLTLLSLETSESSEWEETARPP